ncbi:MAG: hypothetical protein LBH65_01115, partial [Desulfovibrio sp.]|nr:hypothetical protein [Desulfovibrio sp.]
PLPDDEVAADDGRALPDQDDAFMVKEGKGLNLKGVADALCSPPSAILQPLILHNGTFISYTSEGEVLLSLKIVEGRFIPGASDENLFLSASFDLPGADLGVDFSLAARLGCDGIPATGTLSGRLNMSPPGSRSVKGSFVTGFTWDADGKHVSLPDFLFEAEGDKLGADLRVDMAAAECAGRVTLHTLNLPRWFKWARAVPPGLQQALSSLTGGFDLELTPRKAEAHNLEGVAGPLRIKAYVGAPDLSAPVVVVRAEVADKPDLDVVFPFLGVAGRYLPSIAAPAFDHPPLAPYPEYPPVPYDPGPSRVGYDINITAPAALIHGVRTESLFVRVFPHMLGPVEKTRVSIRADKALEGKVEGYLDIDRNSILMHYDAKDMELAGLPENRDGKVKVAGRVTGRCDIDMPMNADGRIVDDWPIRLDAAVRDLTVNGVFRGEDWKMGAAGAAIKGAGSIHAVLEEGVRFEGKWDMTANGIASSWNPRGQEEVTGLYEGGLFWPPIFGGPPPASGSRLVEKKGVERVAGTLTAQGSVTSPLGHYLAPIKGKMKADFEWIPHGERIGLKNAVFEGLGSYAEGSLDIDFSGKETLVRAEAAFKSNPQALFAAWSMRFPSWLRPPQFLTGKCDISADDSSLHFANIKVEMDGAPVTGEITRRRNPAVQDTARTKSDDPGNWTVRLNAEHLDIENIFPPDPPDLPVTPKSERPWDLTVLKGLVLDGRIFLSKAKKGKLSFDKTQVTIAVQRDRFSVECQTDAFYNGTSTTILQGTIVPERSQVILRKGLTQIQKVSLGELLYDYTGERSYAGTAELVADISGVLGCDADFPAKLSGSWSMIIKDGLYPGFLTSEDSTLRNTFSLASASGPLDKGVLRSENFRLSGAMIDMNGGGWFDLNNRTMDIELSATFAKVPTVPVRYYGSVSAPRMRVRGVDMVVETVQAAGFTVFGLVRSVLELPGMAVQG